jgi:UDP-N-acetylglucosamine--N-acetylmuramyl-(pentapeptide) pyrophosphoryl-undecaprenol N-acetylglucosamine transferase
MTTLLVTSVGGHLADLYQLLPRLTPIDDERLWITYDTPQSRSLLEGEDVMYLDYAGPRALGKLARHALVGARLFGRRRRFDAVVSTGSGIALAFLPAGRARGAACHYIECSARSIGPSVTGRLLSHVPGISLYTQYPRWASRRWRYSGCVFDGFAAGPPGVGRAQLRRVVVTLGTMEDYQFRRLVIGALAAIPEDAEVLWQVGCTDVSGLGLEGSRRDLPAIELRRAVEAADVVIAHAGCGSALVALEAGKMPVLVPRLASHDENVDDHQVLIARELEGRNLAVMRQADELTLADLLRAAGSTVRVVSEPNPFPLVSKGEPGGGQA